MYKRAWNSGVATAVLDRGSRGRHDGSAAFRKSRRAGGGARGGMETSA